ncbi:gamma-glutamylcyclotransferase family protein [Lacrimispora aerotolerans]|uniref:gamma-glutamylcyclotransferase family protein n=1 Tax=Lacrimispora aerotolerans TaxID=36832 RepID=UPI0004790999|nr:gamma-glutamylcyclotransferase family protein [Lacrimispora aerotolerans]
MKKETLYIAYGSNLNLTQMAYRCPTAEVIGTSEMKDYEMLFRGSRSSAVATVEPLIGARVPVLLWKIRPQDELALDHYEGYPNFYRKELFPVELSGRLVNAMVYIMNDGRPFGAPSDYYLNTILEGYHSAGFDTDFLEQAVEKSIQLAQSQEQYEPQQGNLFEQRWW